MTTKFALPTMSVPTGKMKITEFQLKNFLLRNDVLLEPQNFKQNELNASKFSSLFGNVQHKNSHSTFDTDDSSPQQQFRIPIKNTKIRLLIPQNKVNLSTDLSQLQNQPSQSNDESMRLTTQSKLSKKRYRNTSFSQKRNIQLLHNRDFSRQQEADIQQNYENLLNPTRTQFTRESFNQTNLSNFEPYDTNPLNQKTILNAPKFKLTSLKDPQKQNKLPYTDIKEDDEIIADQYYFSTNMKDTQDNVQLEVNGLKMDDTIKQDYIQDNKVDRDQKVLKQVILDIPRHKEKVLQTLIKHKIVDDQIQQFSEQVIQAKRHASYMFVEDGRDRYGAQKYSRTSKIAYPGPGSYNMNDNSITNRVQQINFKVQTQQMIKAWLEVPNKN